MMFLALAVLLAGPAEVPKAKPGEIAPTFSLPASNGKTISLGEFKGRKQVVLAFFPKAFTGACTKEMGAFRDHQEAFDEKNAQILAISMDDLDTQTKFAASLKLTFPVLADKGGKVASAYGVKGLLWANRTTFVIDTEGKITAVFDGKDAIDPAVTLAACQRKAP